MMSNLTWYDLPDSNFYVPGIEILTRSHFVSAKY